MAKKYYGVKVDGLIIKANSKEEAEKIFTNKFTANQLEFACVYHDESVYTAFEVEEMRHLTCLHYPECIRDPAIPCIVR